MLKFSRIKIKYGSTVATTMSHLCSFSVEIESPVKELVDAAVKATAEQYHAKVYTGVKEDRYVTVEADYIVGVPVGRTERYIGVRLGDKLEIVGDPYGWHEMFDQVKDKIVQMYITAAILREMQKLGYRVQNLSERDGNVYAEVVM